MSELASRLSESLTSLATWFTNFHSVLVAFSSGIDSSVLACVARRTLGAENTVAVTSISESFAAEELVEAKRIAGEIDIDLVTVFQDDFATPNYVANGVNRCYFCRSNLVSVIQPVASARQIEVCVDGTHIDDLKSPRPGVKALRDAGFRAPFVELGLGKEDVREIARFLQLSNSEKPSESCLASRVAYGQELNLETLRTIEEAEISVKKITGATIVRVRTIGKKASVEVDLDSVNVASKNHSKIETALKNLGYATVEIDPSGYTPGRMLSLFVRNED